MRKRGLTNHLPRLLAVSSALAFLCTATAQVTEDENSRGGWIGVQPRGETVCSDGSDYEFFVREADPERLVVYFQGGGACWNGATCDPDLDPSYRINMAEADPRRADGIMAFENPDNPFKDHSVVFAPYCTGDVHIGNAVTTYEAPTTDEHASHALTVNHKGSVNAVAVLNWTYQNFPRPESVFVAGSSAGSIPSPYYAMLIATQYPEAEIVQLGDGSSGYRRELMTVAPEEQWGTLDVLGHLPEFSSMGASEFTFESLYIAAALRNEHMMFAAFDHAEDGIQKFFLELAGYSADSLLELILANQTDIRAAVSNFRSFIAGGEIHTILLRPEFYSQHVNGVRVRDWVAALANGQPVNDIKCSDCATGEFIAGGGVVVQ